MYNENQETKRKKLPFISSRLVIHWSSVAHLISFEVFLGPMALFWLVFFAKSVCVAGFSDCWTFSFKARRTCAPHPRVKTGRQALLVQTALVFHRMPEMSMLFLGLRTEIVIWDFVFHISFWCELKRSRRVWLFSVLQLHLKPRRSSHKGKEARPSRLPPFSQPLHFLPPF